MAASGNQSEATAGSRLLSTRYYSRQRIRRSFAHYLVGRGVSSIISLFTVFLIIRALSIESYAIYTTLIGLQLVILILSSGGLERVVPRYLPVLREGGTKKELNRLTWRLLRWRIGFLFMILMPVVAFEEFLRDQLSIPDDRWIIWGFYAYVVVQGVTIHLTHSLQALLLQREVTIALSIEWISKLALLLCILALTNTITLPQVIWVNVFTPGLGAIYMAIRLRADLISRGEFGRESNTTIADAELWNTGWHNYFRQVIGLGKSPGSNRILCRYMLDSAATAGLGFAFAIHGMIRRFAPATLLLGLIEPSVMARYSESKDFNVLLRSASIIVKFSLFVLAPAAAWLFFAGQPVAAFVTGGKYTELTWLIAGMMVALMIGSNMTVLTLIANAVNESNSLVRAAVWANALLPIHIVMIWKFGLPGLLGGMLLISWFNNFYLTWRLRRLGYDYRVDFRSLSKIAVFAVVAGAIGSLIPHFVGPSLLTSILAATLTGCVFLSVAFLWKPFSKDERKLLNGYLGKKVFIW